MPGTYAVVNANQRRQFRELAKQAERYSKRGYPFSVEALEEELKEIETLEELLQSRRKTVNAELERHKGQLAL